ncbi:gamma-glutamylcyclotransferase family protein [Hahella sp. SMD15-11]|uniref:Gamma-glutamylcyclotransferase family protein n=1 Tax=Thermohahella caldifontis TaxID=3142973 RepID=A0AB39V1T1_9GAMM
MPGYRLAFNKTAFDGNGTVANAVWTGRPEDRLPVRIATLTPDQLHIMDGFERAPAHYLRTLVDVPLNGDRTLPCHIYLGHPDRLGEGRPSEAYLQHIVTGYAEAGLEPPDPSAGY